MNLEKSSNPVLSEKMFEKVQSLPAEMPMTLQGTINKTLLMFVLLVLGAYYTWSNFFDATTLQSATTAMWPWMIGSGIVGFILAIVISFKPNVSPYLAPLYAIVEGLFLGAISAFFQAMYPGIVFQAVGLTLAVFFLMLFAYKTNVIRATPKFTKIIIMATLGIGVFYLVSFVLSLFGVNMGLMYGNSNLSIIISLVIVGIAALNLILDFDFIERASDMGAPKYMEWYGAFGLMVTIIWLYVEILRLLSKLSSRN